MPTLVVLAAGMGSRYGGLKQIDPVGPVAGESILDYSVYDALRAGFTRTVFVIRRDIEADFRAAIGSRFEEQTDVEYVFQELDAVPDGFTVPAERSKPWGTGHAVLAAGPAVNEPFAVINADDFYGADAFSQLADELGESTPDHYTMVAFQLDKTLSDHGHVSRGFCRVSEQGLLQDIEEITHIERTARGPVAALDDGRSRSLDGAAPVSMNMWGFHPSLFGHLEREFARFLTDHGREPKSEFYLPAAVDMLVKTGQVGVPVRRTDSAWFGVTYREDRPAVCRSIQALVTQGVYPERLWG